MIKRSYLIVQIVSMVFLLFIMQFNISVWKAEAEFTFELPIYWTIVLCTLSGHGCWPKIHFQLLEQSHLYVRVFYKLLSTVSVAGWFLLELPIYNKHFAVWTSIRSSLSLMLKWSICLCIKKKPASHFHLHCAGTISWLWKFFEL